MNIVLFGLIYFIGASATFIIATFMHTIVWKNFPPTIFEEDIAFIYFTCFLCWWGIIPIYLVCIIIQIATWLTLLPVKYIIKKSKYG